MTTLDQGSAMGTGVRLRTSTATIHAMPTPINPPVPGQHRRFHQVLVEDVAAARAQRFADADFVRALRDHRQHDVHDHDAAHHHEDARRCRPPCRRWRRSAAPTGSRMVSEAKMREVVVLPRAAGGGRSAAARAPRPAPRSGARWSMALATMRMPVAAAVGLEVALDRDHHEVVLRLAEDAAQRLGARPPLRRDCLRSR